MVFYLMTLLFLALASRAASGSAVTALPKCKNAPIFDFDKKRLSRPSRAIILYSHIRSAVRSGVRRSSSRTFESAYGYGYTIFILTPAPCNPDPRRPER